MSTPPPSLRPFRAAAVVKVELTVCMIVCISRFSAHVFTLFVLGLFCQSAVAFNVFMFFRVFMFYGLSVWLCLFQGHYFPL